MNLTYWQLLFFSLILGVAVADENPVARVRNATSRVGIINGNKTTIERFPYLVSIMAYGTFLGSGVIVNSNWVMTTAYNAAGFDKEKLVLRVGSDYYNKSGQVHTVSDIVYPSQYKGDNFDWNVAVLKVSSPIKIGKKAKAVNIATTELTNGTKAALVGWGPTTTSTTAPPSKTLVTAEMTVLDKQTCSKAYDVPTRVMCTYDVKAAPTAYDWGDPLIVDDIVYGMYSLGGEDSSYNIAMYTDVSKLSKWITKHTAQ